LVQLFVNREAVVGQPVSVLPDLALLVILGLYVFNYVVNIGFGKSWRRRPLYLLLSILSVAALTGWFVSGSVDNAIFGWATWLWLVYVYGHLGISFLFAAAMATPGCEMRSIPDLLAWFTKQESKEHHCPGFITKIDKWEQGLIENRR
jgi:hypothetical protein